MLTHYVKFIKATGRDAILAELNSEIVREFIISEQCRKISPFMARLNSTSVKYLLYLISLYWRNFSLCSDKGSFPSIAGVGIIGFGRNSPRETVGYQQWWRTILIKAQEIHELVLALDIAHPPAQVPKDSVGLPCRAHAV
jgi:hypothetical protein